MNTAKGQQRWTDVDAFFEHSLIGPDPAMDEVLRLCDEAGLPPHHVAPNQGKMLMLLAQIQGARNILEIGTLGGYSTIWLARALNGGGRVTTIEVDAAHASVAARNIERAGLKSVVTIRVGEAMDVLPSLEPEAPFDLFFIDADKRSSVRYFEWALRLSRPGSVIVFDNVVRGGTVVDEGTADGSVLGIRELNRRLASEPRVEATVIQTVGSKGYDGLAIVRVASRMTPSPPTIT